MNKLILPLLLLGLLSITGSAKATPTDDAYAAIKEKFRALVDAKRPVTWQDWDTFKIGLFDDLKAITPTSGTSSTAATSSGTSDYLYTASDIAKAVASKDQGKGKIIPYFGDYLKAKMAIKANSNGLLFLSNFFVSDPANGMDVKVVLKIKGKSYTFKDTEVAYQLGKSLIAGTVKTTDTAAIAAFLKATPDESKALANTTYKYKFNPKNTAKIEELMENIVAQKFINGPLGDMLVQKTGKTELVEGNEWNDVIWGKKFDGITHGEGESKLGKILMSVRKRIAKGNAKKVPAFEF